MSFTFLANNNFLTGDVYFSGQMSEATTEYTGSGSL